jgi:hypothetical protein
MVSVELDKPCGGWSFLSLEDENGSSTVVLSYIDRNIAINMLKKFYKYLNNAEPCILFEFDGESHGTQVVVVSEKECYVCGCPYDENKGKIYSIKGPDFIEQVLSDICENFVSWVSFDVFGESDEEYYSELEMSKKALTKWIKKVRKELKSYRDTFDELDSKSASKVR